MSMFTDQLPNNETFFANDRLEPKMLPRFGGAKTDADTAAIVADLWSKAYYAKQPEIERMKMMELAYSGFHYKNPKANRQNEITNLCFTTVETVWPVMVETVPRPEIVPRQPMVSGKVDLLRNFATSLMDNSHWDVNKWLGTRTKLKLGWNVNLIVMDPNTGMPYPKQWNPFNFYPDPYATCEADLEYFILAAPVPTRRLRAMFPKKAHAIHPDGIVSPSYDVYVRPYFDNYQSSSPSVVGPNLSFSRESFVDLASGTKGSDPVATTTTSIIDSPGGPQYGQGNDTSFLLQLVVRDYAEKKVTYGGMKQMMSQGQMVQVPHYESYWEPASESGWTVIQMTASGCVLDEAPLDTCFLGLPIVIGRDYWHEGRFYSVGEQDNILPINRAYNKRKMLLNRALEFEALPLMLVDRDIGADIDATSFEPGDTIKANRGARAEWLNFQGPQSGQFELLTVERMDSDIVSGVHDAQAGRKPAGVESGVAMRQLQEAGQTRIRGKERPGFHEDTILLKKMMYCAAKKLNRMIMFSVGGQQMSISPQELLSEYDIRFAQGTGMASSKADLEEKLLSMFQLGLIDRQAVLEQSDIPGWQAIAQRMAMMEQINMQMQMATAASGGQSAPPGK